MPQANFADGTKVCSNRLCELAGQPQPLTNYSRDKDRQDGLRSNCNVCRNKTKRGPRRSPEWNAQKKQEKEEKRTEKRTAMIVSGMNKVVAQQGTIVEEMAAQWVHAAGGISEMANDFWATMRTANETTKIRGYQATMALMKDASALQQARQQDVGTIPDEVLDELLKERLMKLAELRGHIIDGELANEN